MIKVFSLLLFYLSGLEAELNAKWWRHTNIYEIVLYAFKDSNDDGIGDLKGLTSKLDHLVDVGVETVYLTPIMNSTMLDIGYDVTNYFEIDPKYGTMEDFEELIEKMHARGLKLILDLVINHSSYDHEWFKNSVDKIEPYTDYYVWANPMNYSINGDDKPMEPNHWRNIFGGSVWKWNEKRQQFYYHAFLKEQPDLNLRNDNVKTEVKKIIKFWLDKGVSGFRLDAAMSYLEDKYLRENKDYYGMENQVHYFETYRFLHDLRVFFDEYNHQHGGYERILTAEVNTYGSKFKDYYGTENYPIVHLPFYSWFSLVKFKFNAEFYDISINFQLRYLPRGQSPTWARSGHDVSRVGSSICPEYNDIYTISLGLLPGIMINYYGDEIGLMDGYIQFDQIVDKSASGWRDPNRLPMQWDGSINAGFSKNETVIAPPNTDYYARNVKNQKQQPVSHFTVFKTINKLRKTKTIKYGSFESLVPSTNHYIYLRR